MLFVGVFQFFVQKKHGLESQSLRSQLRFSDEGGKIATIFSGSPKALGSCWAGMAWKTAKSREWGKMENQMENSPQRTGKKWPTNGPNMEEKWKTPSKILLPFSHVQLEAVFVKCDLVNVQHLVPAWPTGQAPQAGSGTLMRLGHHHHSLSHEVCVGTTTTKRQRGEREKHNHILKRVGLCSTVGSAQRAPFQRGPVKK